MQLLKVTHVDHIGKSLQCEFNKLLLLSLGDYALTVLHFKDVLFNM